MFIKLSVMRKAFLSISIAWELKWNEFCATHSYRKELNPDLLGPSLFFLKWVDAKLLFENQIQDHMVLFYMDLAIIIICTFVTLRLDYCIVNYMRLCLKSIQKLKLMEGPAPG